jgi:hypothetical protein
VDAWRRHVSPAEGIAYHFGDHSLKLQGFIGIVALQGLSGLYSDHIDTVPYILQTFDRVLRRLLIIPSFHGEYPNLHSELEDMSIRWVARGTGGVDELAASSWVVPNFWRLIDNITPAV